MGSAVAGSRRVVSREQEEGREQKGNWQGAAGGQLAGSSRRAVGRKQEGTQLAGSRRKAVSREQEEGS